LSESLINKKAGYCRRCYLYSVFNYQSLFNHRLFPLLAKMNKTIMSRSYASNVFAYLSFKNFEIPLEFVVLNSNCYILSDNNILTENRHTYANNSHDDNTTIGMYSNSNKGIITMFYQSFVPRRSY